MFIGAIHPRKNVLGLLKAFEQYKSKYHLPHSLKIAGRKAWMNSELEKYYQQMHYKADVEWISTTDRSALMLMLKHAQALVFPGFFEGFGIPILEAMSLGVPVITSDLSAMPEVAGDAALLINPHEPAAIAEAMFQLATDEALRNECIRKGKARSAVFSWDKSAQQVAALIEQFSA
jgi:glycosyltransferase involved in cell wall biosynthesis